jgi:branched-chain amino acid transport system substrate-binding protein
MWGQAAFKVDKIYYDLVNERGGVKVGDTVYKIQLCAGDDSFLPSMGAAAARKLIYSDKVSAIVGYVSPGFNAVSPITNAEKVIFICRSGGGVIYNPKTHPYVVFGFPSMENTLNQAIAIMQAYPQYKTLCWSGTEGDKREGELAMEETNRMLEREYGIKSVRVYYPEATTNFTPYLSKMAELGTEVIYSSGTPLEIALMAKQRWAMGLKWPLAETASQMDPPMFLRLCGEEAGQGVISDRPVPWELKKTTVAPRFLEIAKTLEERHKEQYGIPIQNYGIFASSVGMTAQYLEIVQQAGTIDPDKVMSTVRGGTFDTFLGTYKLSGEKTYGSPIVFGYPGAVGQIEGDKEIPIGEYPLVDADYWTSKYAPKN